MKDSRERFSATVDAYARYRPGYPAAFFDWLENITGIGARERSTILIADIACGTGISTRPWAERGYRVIGIDPNEDMLKNAVATELTRPDSAATANDGRASSSVTTPTYLRGEATRTGLADASCDLITAAQAFHWFDVDATLAEFKRALKPDGWVCAYWNARQNSPFMDAYDELLMKHSTEYPKIPRFHDRLEQLAAHPRGHDKHRCLIPNGKLITWPELVGRLDSASYVQHGIADRTAFDRAMKTLFDQHAALSPVPGGEPLPMVDFLYSVEAVVFRIA